MKITFFSPGTFLPEVRTLETELQDPMQIAELAHNVKERYGATPFGFRIENSRRTYYLGGTIKTLADIPNTPENEVLRANMINNKIERVIENNNSWNFIGAFYEEDVLLDWKPQRAEHLE